MMINRIECSENVNYVTSVNRSAILIREVLSGVHRWRSGDTRPHWFTVSFDDFLSTPRFVSQPLHISEWELDTRSRNCSQIAY